jgi:hypothetical protein
MSVSTVQEKFDEETHLVQMRAAREREVQAEQAKRAEIVRIQEIARNEESDRIAYKAYERENGFGGWSDEEQDDGKDAALSDEEQEDGKDAAMLEYMKNAREKEAERIKKAVAHTKATSAFRESTRSQKAHM